MGRKTNEKIENDENLWERKLFLIWKLFVHFANRCAMFLCKRFTRESMNFDGHIGLHCWIQFRNWHTHIHTWFADDCKVSKAPHAHLYSHFNSLKYCHMKCSSKWLCLWTVQHDPRQTRDDFPSEWLSLAENSISCCKYNVIQHRHPKQMAFWLSTL